MIPSPLIGCRVYRVPLNDERCPPPQHINTDPFTGAIYVREDMWLAFLQATEKHCERIQTSPRRPD